MTIEHEGIIYNFSTLLQAAKFENEDKPTVPPMVELACEYGESGVENRCSVSILKYPRAISEGGDNVSAAILDPEPSWESDPEGQASRIFGRFFTALGQPDTYVAEALRPHLPQLVNLVDATW